MRVFEEVHIIFGEEHTIWKPSPKYQYKVRGGNRCKLTSPAHPSGRDLVLSAHWWESI